MINFKAWYLNESKSLEKELLRNAKEVKGKQSFLNCRLFIQLLTGINKIESLPKLKSPKVGSILWWGSSSNYLHVAIMLNKNTMLHVDEWGADPEEMNIKKYTDEYGKWDRIYDTDL